MTDLPRSPVTPAGWYPDHTGAPNPLRSRLGIATQFTLNSSALVASATDQLAVDRNASFLARDVLGWGVEVIGRSIIVRRQRPVHQLTSRCPGG